MASEKASVVSAENTKVVTAFNRIPYALINAELKSSTSDALTELTDIMQFYKVYKKGAEFIVEGSNGDYVPATLKYKMAASLVNKQARFLFAEKPDLIIEAKGDVGKVSEEAKKALTVMQDVVTTILDENKFEEALIKAAKDCFIGRRVAGLINFNEEDGVTLTFLPSTQFVYETKVGNPNIITKFVAFIIIQESTNLADRQIFRKRYTLENDVVFLEETMYDGAGREIAPVTEKQPILLPMIPVSIFINDGLTGEKQGESEIEHLEDFESYYSKLANADTDAERKSMNPTRYAVDMDNRSTKNLSSGAGAFWDLASDQNLVTPQSKVGILESSMTYSESLNTTLERIKTTGYEQVDVPIITQESMRGMVTSGKTLKAIYWPLIVRCKEKMKMWGPQLSNLVKIIIEGSMIYPNCIEQYTNDPVEPVDYMIKVEANYPLLEDELEEKNMDLAEVDSKTMSRKTYMQKWRQLTDDQVNEELEQIVMERQMIDDSSLTGHTNIDLDDGPLYNM